MPLERATLTRGDREVRSTTRTCRGYLGLPEGPRKTAKKLFDCEDESGKRADSCIHGQGITIFARDRPQLYIAALKRKSQSINSLPYYSRNEI